MLSTAGLSEKRPPKGLFLCHLFLLVVFSGVKPHRSFSKSQLKVTVLPSSEIGGHCLLGKNSISSIATSPV